MTTIVDAPARADGLQLLGPMVGSGYRTPPALVRRGRRADAAAHAAALRACWTPSTGAAAPPRSPTVREPGLRREVSADVVATLVDQHLRPLGLLKLADGSEPELKRSDPLLGLKLKFAVTDPATTRRLTDPFRVLFRPAGHGRGRAGVPGGDLVGLLRARTRARGVRRLPAAAPAAARLRGDRALRRLPRVRARGRRPLRRRRPGRDRGRASTSCGRRSTPTSPTATGSAAADGCAPTWAGSTSTPRGGAHLRLVVGHAAGTRCCSSWPPRSCRWCSSCCRCCASTATTCWPTWPASPTSTSASGRPCSACCRTAGRTRRTGCSSRGRALVITAWVLVTIPMMALMLLALVMAVPRLVGTAWSVVGEDAAGVRRRPGAPAASSTSPPRCPGAGVVLPAAGGRADPRAASGCAGPRAGGVEPGLGAQAGRRRPPSTPSSSSASPGRGGRSPGAYRPIGPDEKGLLTAAAARPAARGAGAGRRRAGVAEAASAPSARPPSVGWPATAPLQATFPGRARCPRKADAPAGGRARPERRGRRRWRTAGRLGRAWVFPFDKPLRPRRATTRRRRTTPPTTRSATTSPSRWCGRRATRCSTSTRPTPTPRARTA